MPFVLLHDDIISTLQAELAAIHGGQAGQRELSMLKMLMARAEVLNESASTDLASLAACYGYGLAKDELFYSNNLATALAVIELFLTLNGQQLLADDTTCFLGISVVAVPAYNLIHKRESGEFYHPKGEGNGYVLTFGDTRVYIAGDTENTPEMKALEDIDYAFLPMNLPYTMTPEMVADAVSAFKPKVLYPYHYGDTDISELVELLKGNTDTEVRIRKMQ